MSEAIVAPALHYNTVDPTTGEVIEHNADMTFEQRQADLKQEEEAKKQAQEREKKSPFSNFAQLNLDQTEALIKLTRISPRAAEIFLFLIDHMDGHNALVCSHTVLQEALDISRPTITRAIKVLKDTGFIDIKKSGTTNIYLINKEIVWKSWGRNYKYAEFGAKIIITGSEQEKNAPKVKTTKHAVAEIKPSKTK